MLLLEKKYMQDYQDKKIETSLIKKKTEQRLAKL